MHFKVYPFSIILIFLFIGCSSTTVIRKFQSPSSRLRSDINEVLSDSLFSTTQASVKVVSLETNEVLYDRNSQLLFHPASNTKLFSSAAALAILDTNYQFSTSLYCDTSSWETGSIENLYFKGYGNPDLTTKDVDSMAFLIANLGIKRITKDIVIDDSYFDNRVWGSGWTWDDDPDPDAPFIDALTVNKDCIKITLITDSANVRFKLEPQTNFVTVINNLKLVPDSVSKSIKIKRVKYNNINTLTIDGGINAWDQYSEKITLFDPDFYAAFLLKEALQKYGIEFSGSTRSDIVPPGCKEIVRLSSPIEQVVTNLNKVSDNLSAECVLKILGARTAGAPGTSRNGLYAVRTFISKYGIDTTKLSLVDGSGVSRYNLISTDIIVKLLIGVHKDPRIFSHFYDSLPVAGVDDTISRRMAFYPAYGNLHAKTGHLNGVSSLSGYVQTKDGEMLAFSMMMQHYLLSSSFYDSIQDKIGNILARFSRR